ncbi:hypothetical protein GEMRC1_002625 [Eukaryota sp. GEM-RC1]
MSLSFHFLDSLGRTLVNDARTGVLDKLEPPRRNITGALRVPLSAKLRDRGAACGVGKVETGTVNVGTKVVVMPENLQTEISGIYIEDVSVEQAFCGDNVRIALKGISDDDFHPGSIICPADDPCPATCSFDAHLVIMDVKNIIAPGYQAVLHIHSLICEVEVDQILAEINPKTKEIIQKRPRFVRQGQHAAVRLKTTQPIAVDTFERCKQLGRFVLRSEGVNVAIGMIRRIK